MTLQELYHAIDGDYAQAIRVLHVEKLLDKHIRKFPASGVVDAVLAAGKTMDPTALFEAGHALKGVSANLGLVKISELAAQVTEEFRPGASRRLSDAEVAQAIARIGEMYQKTAAAIKQYMEG